MRQQEDRPERGLAGQDSKETEPRQCPSLTGTVPAPLLRRKSQDEGIHEVPVQIQTGPEEKGSGDWWRGSKPFLAVFSGAGRRQVELRGASEAPVALPIREDALLACWASAHSLRQKKGPCLFKSGAPILLSL